jgi:hypothetical protein
MGFSGVIRAVLVMGFSGVIRAVLVMGFSGVVRALGLNQNNLHKLNKLPLWCTNGSHPRR